MQIDANPHRTPGQLIAAALKEKEWTQRVLAIVLGMDETGINKLIADKRPVTAELAVALEEVLGTPAKALLDLQSEFDLAKARYAVRPDPGRTTRAHIFSGLPVAEMIRRGWLDAPDVRDVPAVEAALRTFFGTDDLDDIPVLPHAPRKTDLAANTTPAQVAWLYRAREIASEMLVARYTPSTGRRTLPRLSALLSSAEEARKVPRILAESGIRYVVVESLSSAKIDGACFWLNDESPVVAMTLRYDRIDNFWFVLRHELEHMLRGHGRETPVIVDSNLDGSQDRDEAPLEERLANAAAAEFCVPQDKLQRFIERKEPFFSERDIVGFAKTLGIHPGLVAGQLQHKTGRYERFRKHLVTIREIVRPNAVVDGWGDIAPIGL